MECQQKQNHKQRHKTPNLYTFLFKCKQTGIFQIKINLLILFTNCKPHPQYNFFKQPRCINNTKLNTTNTFILLSTLSTLAGQNLIFKVERFPCRYVDKEYVNIFPWHYAMFYTLRIPLQVSKTNKRNIRIFNSHIRVCRNKNSTKRDTLNLCKAICFHLIFT